MRVFACAIVKLLLPAAGAAGVGVLDVVTAGVLGFGFAGGALVCAKAAAVDSAKAPARKTGFTEISMILVVRHYNAFSRCVFHHANESGSAYWGQIITVTRAGKALARRFGVIGDIRTGAGNTRGRLERPWAPSGPARSAGLRC
jgi:hypothetical protein